MVKLSKQADYAIQFLLELAGQTDNAPLSLRKFSKDSNISFLFLQRIAGKLREADFVNSIQGPRGGYVLAKSVSEISLADIARVVDGEFNTIDCIKYNKKCALVHMCTKQGALNQINRDILNYLQNLTIDKYANI